MASESVNSNVLLTGQTAYVKKQGSMVNLGTIVIPNTETSVPHTYENGFIDEGSKIEGTILEDTTDYKTCEQNMRMYLAQDFDDKTEGYTVKNNAVAMANTLLPEAIEIQKLRNKII